MNILRGAFLPSPLLTLILNNEAMQIVFHAYGLEHSISFQLYTRLLLRNSQFLRNQLLMLQLLVGGGGWVREVQNERSRAGASTTVRTSCPARCVTSSQWH